MITLFKWLNSPEFLSKGLSGKGRTQNTYIKNKICDKSTKPKNRITKKCRKYTNESMKIMGSNIFASFVALPFGISVA